MALLIRRLLITTGYVVSATAVWHILCIFAGPSWFEFARAPRAIIASAHQGTWLAPISTIIVALLMFMSAAYAFSAAGLLRKLPFQRTALFLLTLLCLVRFFIALPFFIVNGIFDTWQIIASTIWLMVGITYLCGLIQFKKSP